MTYDPTDGCPGCGTLTRVHDDACEYVNRPPDPDLTPQELAAMEAAWREEQAYWENGGPQ